jgi:proline racemase
MSTRFNRVIHTIDSHTEGNPTRVITGGVPVPPGKTLLDKREWLWRHDDGLRRLLNFEPRGSAMMCSVLVLPPVAEKADFSVVIMEQDEYVPMCGHCLIGTATTVLANGMVKAMEPVTTVTFETPGGIVRCDVSVENGDIGAVALTNVPSFVLHQGKSIEVPELGRIGVDVAYGGDFYAYIDADAIGLDIGPENDAEMIRLANMIIPAVNDQLDIRHPDRPDINRCYQTFYHSKNTTTGDYRQTIIAPPGALDRSPCGTGTSSRIAMLLTRQEVGLGEARLFEGPLGTVFKGEAVDAQERDGILFVTPKVSGRAYVTGFHQFVLDPEDPLPQGFRFGAPPRDVPMPSR